MFFHPQSEANGDKTRSHIQLPICEKVPTKTRSHSIHVDVYDLDDEDDQDANESELELVGIHDEILLIKSQFDKLISVLKFDNDLFRKTLNYNE